jgi:hypothetical protein
MGIPSVVRLLPFGASISDPVEGPTAGRQLIEIWGDGFRLPNTDPVPLVPGQPFVVAPKPRSVSVTFNGTEALKVEVRATNLLRVLTPSSSLPSDNANNNAAGVVDVVIQNLDDNEDPIPGEVVVLPAAYTYRRIKLDALNEHDLTRMVRTLIRMLKVQVLPEVILTSETDFDRDVSTAFVEIAKTPAIVLVGPSTPENRFYSKNAGDDELVDGVVQIRKKPHTVDLNFDLIGISNNPMELVNLMALTTTFIDSNPYIFMQKDPNDPSKGSAKYEFDFQPGSSFSTSAKSNNANIQSFSGAITIRGFDIEGFQGFNGAILEALSETLSEGVILDVAAKQG